MALGSQNASAAIRSPVLGILGVWGTRSAEAAVGEELDGHSVEAESNFEILRAQRAQARKGVKTFKDIRENEGAWPGRCFYFCLGFEKGWDLTRRISTGGSQT